MIFPNPIETSTTLLNEQTANKYTTTNVMRCICMSWKKKRKLKHVNYTKRRSHTHSVPFRVAMRNECTRSDISYFSVVRTQRRRIILLALFVAIPERSRRQYYTSVISSLWFVHYCIIIMLNQTRHDDAINYRHRWHDDYICFH